MDYPVVLQPRSFKSYSMDSITEGLYVDLDTRELFASTKLLADLVRECEDFIDGFIDADPDRQSAVKIVIVKSEEGLQACRLHPESTVRAVIKEYKPDLSEDLKGCEFYDFLDRLAMSSCSVEPISDDTQQQWTLYEWMIGHCEIVLETKLFNKFKSKVHRLYKDTYRCDPRTSYRNQAKNPSQVTKLQVYTPTEFPVLQVCYMRTLMEVRCHD